MISINNKNICENCFEELKISRCPCCGYDPSDCIFNPTLLKPGNILSNKYIIGGVIGIGGFGVTYLAYDKDAQTKVAVKEYFPREASHRDSDSTEITADDAVTFDLGAEKFYNEAEIVSGFKDNPNIVKIYDIIRANSTVYLVMEFLRGKNIKEYVCGFGTLDPKSALYVAQSVLNALSAVHSANVLHRDISPDNVILCPNGDVKLIDFGTARRVVEDRTQNFTTIVKYGFAPPEQYRRKTDQGAWSDIYSLGATIYYALTGDIPADPMLRYDDDDTFGENNFGIEQSLWNIIVKATKLSPEERYRNVEEMRAALAELPYTPKPLLFTNEEPLRPVFKSRSGSVSSEENNKADAKIGSRKRRRIALTAAAVGVAACACVPFIINGVRSGSAPQTSEPYSSSSSSSTSSSVVSEPDIPLSSLPETFPLFGGYETKPWYLGMTDKQHEIYKIIYEGLVKQETSIKFPDRTYTQKDVESCYYLCVYDNPWLCNIGSFGYTYEDDNGNKSPEPDEYIVHIEPDYLQFEVETNKLRAEIESKTNQSSDPVEALCLIHDNIIHEVSITARYTNQSCTHAYGSIVHKLADDMGIAQGFCVYAQALGLQCRVIDGVKNEQARAWCAVKIDDTWYNIDVYGDMFAHSEVDGNIFTDRNGVFRTYFLVNDENFKKMGYEPNGGWEVFGGKEFAADSPYDNYYIQCVKGESEYFNTDEESAYDRLLKKAAEAFKSGSKEISICVAPYLVNKLQKHMEETFISDCNKYGVTILSFREYYTPDAYTITLTL